MTITIPPQDAQRAEVARSIADYEVISGILWIVLGVIQLIDLVTAVAGVWNIVAGISRLSMAKRVRALDPGVPAAYEGLTQLIVIAIVNLLLGGVFGLIFVGLDLFIRSRVLANRSVFTGQALPVLGYMAHPNPPLLAQPAAQTPTAGALDLNALEAIGRLRNGAC